MKNTKLQKYYPWIVVALLWVVALLNYMDRQMLSTMRESMQVDIAELEEAVNFGRLMAIFLWIYGLVSPVAGAVADRISRKWLIVGSLGVWSAVTLLMGYSTSFGQIYWLRALMGISEALYIPASLSLIADYHTGKARSFAIGVHMTGLYVGQAVGGFGATVASMFSWQETFHWFGIIGIAYAVVLIFFLHENRGTRQSEAEAARPKADLSVWRSFGLLLSNIAFWVVLFYFASSSLPGWATKNWLPTLFADSLGVPMSAAGPISTFTIAFSSFLGVMIGGPLSDRWVKRNLRGRIYTSAIGLGLMVPALVLLGLGHGMYAAVGAGLCFGVGFGMFDTNNMPILCQFVPVRLRATAYGIMNMTGVFAGAACTEVLGRWADGGNLGLGFALLGGVIAVALFVQLSVLRPTTDNMERSAAGQRKRPCRTTAGPFFMFRGAFRDAGPSVDDDAGEVFAEQRGGPVELFGRVLPDVAQPVFESHRLVFVYPERVVGQQLDPLDHAVAAQPFAQRADVLFGVAVTRNQHVAQPKGLCVLLEPGSRAQRLRIVAAGEGAVALRRGLLDVEQHQIDQPQQLLDGRVPHPAVRVEADMDAGLLERADQRDESCGLEGRFATREGDASAAPEEGFLIDGHAENLRGLGRLAAAGLDRIGVGAVETAEVAALQENDEPESRPVESSHGFVGVYANHAVRRFTCARGNCG